MNVLSLLKPDLMALLGLLTGIFVVPQIMKLVATL